MSGYALVHKTYPIRCTAFSHDKNNLTKYLIVKIIKGYYNHNQDDFEDISQYSMSILKRAWEGQDFDIHELDDNDLNVLLEMFDEWEIMETSVI